MPHRPQVEAFEDIQNLERHDALCPCRVAAYLVSEECSLDRLAVFRLVVCEVVRIENATDLPRVSRHALGYGSLVEGVVSGAYAVYAAAVAGVLGGDHLLEHVREVLLYQHRAGLGYIAVLEEDVHAARREEVELLARAGAVEALQHVLVVGEAELRVVYGGSKHLAERLGAVAFQHGRERRDNRRYGEGHRRVGTGACRNLVEAARLVEVNGCSAGRGALSAE